MPGKKKQVIRGRAKASAPKVRRTTVSPAPRRTVDPGWAWDDRLPLAQGKQIGNTIYIMPPYCSGESELGLVYEAITDLADEIL